MSKLWLTRDKHKRRSGYTFWYRGKPVWEDGIDFWVSPSRSDVDWGFKVPPSLCPTLPKGKKGICEVCLTRRSLRRRKNA